MWDESFVFLMLWCIVVCVCVCVVCVCVWRGLARGKNPCVGSKRLRV